MIAAVDLTEASLVEMLEQIKLNMSGPYHIEPTRFILPRWVIREIEAEFGAPATPAKYHQWNMRRTGLSEREYWSAVAPELVST